MAIVRSTEALDGEQVAILIEVDHATRPVSEDAYGQTRAGHAERVIEGAQDLFDEGLQLARNCAKQVVGGIQKLDEQLRPAEFQVALAITLDAEVGAILAKSSAGAQLQVTMTWKPASVRSPG